MIARRDLRRSYSNDITVSRERAGHRKLSRRYKLSWTCRMCMTIRRVGILDSKRADSEGPHDYDDVLWCQWADIRDANPFFEFVVDIFNSENGHYMDVPVVLKRWQPEIHTKRKDDQLHIHEYPAANHHKSLMGMYTSSGAASSLQNAKQWIAQCDQCHKCSQSRVNFCPTRLLDLGEATAPQDSISLIERDHLEEVPPYATLSHCWGGQLPIRLQQDNVGAFKLGLDSELLPPTFRDAIKVTRALGLRDLWIDALCIVQDSQEDWLCESKTMHAVYGGCYVNISASASKAASEGLFRKRPMWWTTQEYTFLEDSPPGVMFTCGDWSSVWSCPLNTRAWVFQERILSSRVLHFTETEIFWECQALRASETCPDGFFQHWPGSEWFFAVSSFDKPIRLADWSGIVENYTARRFSHWTDRLIAISGVARILLENCKLSEKDYIAGMWRERLTEDLLWKSHDHKNGEKSPITSMPTWSWASNQGGVSFSSERGQGMGRWQYRDLDLYRLLHVDRQRDCDPFGATSSSILVISCPLITIRGYSEGLERRVPNETVLGRFQRSRGRFLDLDGSIIIDHNTVAHANPDRPWDTHATYLLAPLRISCINYPWQRQLDFTLQGLILREVDTDRAKFFRAGIAGIEERNSSYEDLERIMFDLKLLDFDHVIHDRQSQSISSDRRKHQKPEESGKLPPRARKYFDSQVFMLTKRRGDGNAAYGNDYIEHSCSEGRHDRESNADLGEGDGDGEEGEVESWEEGDGKMCPECLYIEEEKAGRGFPAPFPSKKRQFENFKSNIQEWCDRAPDWQTIYLQ